MELLKNIISIPSKKFNIDFIFRASIVAFSAAVVALVGTIFIFLFYESWSSISSVIHNDYGHWSPLEGEYNIFPMILGSFLVMGGAVLISTPLSIASAIYSNFYASLTIRYIYSRIIDVLAGIPSVIYGVWGLMVIVPLFSQIKAPGTSILAGVLVLSLMIMPIGSVLINRIIEDLDKEHRRSAYALGIPRLSYILKLILPLSIAQIGNVLLLKAGRAIGETMIVVMVCGNIVQVPNSIFDSIRTLTANIALELGYAEGLHRSYLFLCGLILVVSVYFLVFIIEKLSNGNKNVKF